MRKRINLNDIVVYNQNKRQPRSVIQQVYIDEVVKHILEPKAEVKQLTDKDGLDRSYNAEKLHIHARQHSLHSRVTFDKSQ